jgi:hypothetical protein
MYLRKKFVHQVGHWLRLQILVCTRLNLLLFSEYYVTVTNKINCWKLVRIGDANVCLGVEASYENLSWHPYERSRVNCVSSGSYRILYLVYRASLYNLVNRTNLVRNFS